MAELHLESKLEENILTVRFALPAEAQRQYEYAYYLIKDGVRMLTEWYSANSEARFILDEPGAYYVTSFIREIEEKSNLSSKNTKLHVYPSQENSAPPMNSAQALLESEFTILSKVDDSSLQCEIQPCNNDFRDLEFAFYLMDKFEKIKTTSYSPYNRVRFDLPTAGIYAVKCFIKRGQELLIKTSPFHGYSVASVARYEEEYCHPFGQPSYIPLEAPYTDFCLVVTNTLLADKALNDITQYTRLHIDKEPWNQSYIYKIGNETIVQQNTILSGMVNEGTRLIFGQKDIAALEGLIADGLDVTTMTGKFMVYKKDDAITVTCDYFAANSVFYFRDGETSIVANRLNLILLVIRAMKRKTTVNNEYVAATMTFNDGMISGTNFLSELAIKNLFILPVNRYIEITSCGLRTPAKPINYEKVPYDDKEYRALLYKAKDDMINKLENITDCEDITHYKISLSGGFDSRLNLAILLHNKKAREETNALTRDVASANDLEVSLQLTNYFGLSYARNEKYHILFQERSATSFIERYRNFNNGLYHIINQFPGLAATSDIENQTVNFIGAFGEAMRSRYYMNIRSFAKNSDTLTQITKKMTNKLDSYHITYFGDGDFRKALSDEIAGIPGETDCEKFDNLYTFHHLRYHFNDLINKLSGDGHYYSLFMSPYLFEASRMLTMEERCNNKVILDMCYILCPETLSFPFSSYGAQDADITSDKWGNVLFDPAHLPAVKPNYDRSHYDAVTQENSPPAYPQNDTLLLHIYNNTLKLYSILRNRPDIGMYFDEHLYYYIQCVKDDLRQLLRIFSKLCGIYDQIYIAESF